MLLAFVDTPQRHGRLTVFPVLASDEPQLSYLLMAEALTRGSLVLQRTGPDEPPHLIIQNRGSLPVLILDCEVMQETGENRATNQSVLLGPDTVTKLPTACMDPGKWCHGERDADFTETLRSFPKLDGQVGILASLGRQLLGLDALGSPELYSPLHRRLLTGYLITALAAGERAEDEEGAEEKELMALARALESAARVAAPCPGYGEYSTIHGDVVGGELRHNGHLVHLSVFPNGVAA